MSGEEKELTALKNGSYQAFEAIYKRYAGKLYNFIMTLSHGDCYMAEEIVQSVFIKLWEVHHKHACDPRRQVDHDQMAA